MRSLLDRLRGRAATDESGADVSAMRRIVAKLEALEPDQARFLAAFAFVLSRVAYADRHFSGEETRAMEKIVRELGGLPEEQTILVVEIAKAQNRLFGGTENFLVTRELKATADKDQKLHLLDCLFAVSAADDSISGSEEAQIRQVASELGFTHAEFIAARLAYSDKREILRPLLEASGDEKEEA